MNEAPLSGRRRSVWGPLASLCASGGIALGCNRIPVEPEPGGPLRRLGEVGFEELRNPSCQPNGAFDQFSPFPLPGGD